MRDTQKFIPDLVCVIVPVYNSEEYLHTCIKSIMDQSYNNIEILLIDGCSTDNSGKICDEYAVSDKRVMVIHKKDNGPAEARNTGIKNSKGEFIFFLDSDDYIEIDAIKLLIDSYKEHKADLIIGDFKKIKNGIVENRNDISLSGNKLLTKRDLTDYSRSYLKKPNRYLLFAFSWGRLFKSSIIKNNNIFFNVDLHTFEDVAFNFDYLNYTNEAFFLKQPIYNHIIHDSYLSATMSIGGNPKKLFGYKQALASIGNFLKYSVTDAEIKKEVGHAYIFLTIIQFVRMCGQINNDNEKKIIQLIHELINDPNLMDNLNFYSPSKGDSKVLPLMMKLKFTLPVIWICKYKAHKRYKKGRIVK